MAITLVVEDGTGLAAANVYDLAVACDTWLSDRGFTAYAAGGSAEQDRWLLEATETIERASSARVDGVPTGGDDQAMLYPRAGATDRRGRRHDSDERPAVYREGIFLLAEDIGDAGATRISLASDRVVSESSAAGSITYLNSDVTLQERYPAAFAKAAEAYPAGIRAQRA